MSVIKLQVSNEIWLATSQVDDELARLIQKELSFANPKLGELLRMGYSIWKVPKRIVCYRKLKSGYYLPIGYGPRLRAWLRQRGDEVRVDDRRVEWPVTAIATKIQLKPAQEKVQAQLLQPYRSILEAKPGFGKTMLGITVMSERAQRTLIIVHTRSLLQQWWQRLQDFCVLDEGEVGMIGEGKWRLGARVTIASYQTLLSRGTKELQDQFGLVIVDECHHVPANTFAKVVRSFPAKYCLGLTATPFRKDKLDRLMNFYVGKIVPAIDPNETGMMQTQSEKKVPTRVIWRETELVIPLAEEKEFTELGTLLAEDVKRQRLVVGDVLGAIKRGGKILVLSERVGHAEALYQALQQARPDVPMVLVTGQMKKNQREELLAEIKQNHYQVMVATGGVVGEGFDWPALDHLFLTFPFSWRGKAIQYVGRVQRVAAGKTQALVYDYVDSQVNIFRAMQYKRRRAYTELEVTAQEYENLCRHCGDQVRVDKI